MLGTMCFEIIRLRFRDIFSICFSIQRRQGPTPRYVLSVGSPVRVATPASVAPRMTCAPQEMHPAPDAPPQEMRGAGDAPEGCTSCGEGVHLVRERGAPPAPKPSGTSIEPSENRQLERAAGATTKPKRRCTLPDDWAPGEKGRAFAAARSVPISEVERFRDYHAAKGTLMADWDAAWRTWCGNHARFNQRSGGQDNLQQFRNPWLARQAAQASRAAIDIDDDSFLTPSRPRLI